jgi:hypothetical protein
MRNQKGNCNIIVSMCTIYLIKGLFSKHGIHAAKKRVFICLEIEQSLDPNLFILNQSFMN